jgi:hypothetical protein
METFLINDIVFNKAHNTIGIVRGIYQHDGIIKTDADGNVNKSDLELYNPLKREYKNPHVSPSNDKEINTRGLYNPYSNDFQKRDKQMVTQQRITALKAKVNELKDELMNEINDITNNLDYVNGSKFSYNSDRLNNFVNELNNFEIK